LYDIISTLRQSVIVLDIEVLELVDEDSIKLIKIKVLLKENLILYITELNTKGAALMKQDKTVVNKGFQDFYHWFYVS